MIKLVAVLVAITALAHPLVAQQAPRVACLDTARTQWAMTACASNALKTLDTVLAHLVAELHQTLPPAEALQLDSTQASWVTYTSVQCRLASSESRDGSAFPMLVSVCRGSYAAERIKELAPLLCSRTQLGATPCPAADRYLAEEEVVRPSR